MVIRPRSEDHTRERFFERVTQRLSLPSDFASLVVTHVVPDRPYFLQALGKLTRIGSIVPKPRSVHPPTLDILRRTYHCDELTRDRLADVDFLEAFVRERVGSAPTVLLDIGGYFAPGLHELNERLPGQVLGVVEDTENGFRRYLALGELPCPVFSVARSPLKNPEDYLVGQATVFSVEQLLRSCGQILQGREAAVFGYGKLGRSVAALLHAKSVHARIVEIDPVRAVEALANGFPLASKRQALQLCDLLICATGNLSLQSDDFAAIRNGTFLASVTSSDDELELAGLASIYESEEIAPHVARYQTSGQYFYLLNDGNAVNFIHGAVVGPFIYLVQAEILAALFSLCTSAGLTSEFHEVDTSLRAFIAETWLDCFSASE